MTAGLSLPGGTTQCISRRGPPPGRYRGGRMTDVPPEADALEQHQEVVPHEAVESVPDDPEVPEADALEQAQAVPVDDEDMRG